MKKLIILFALFIIVNNSVYSQNVKKEEALKAVSAFLSYNKNTNISLLLQPTSIREDNIKTIISNEEQELAYIVELNPQGYIVTSCDRKITPIIAYSFNCNFNYIDKESNILLKMLKYDLALRVKNIGVTEKSVLDENMAKWESMLVDNNSIASNLTSQQWPEAGTTITGGWIETAWHQFSPYNDFCPLDLSNINHQRAVAGCTATAWAQLINYYQSVSFVHLDGTDYYTTRTKGIQIDKDSTQNDFPSFNTINVYLDRIKYKYAANQAIDNQEIAALNFMAGIQSMMDYSAEGSAAAIFILPYKNKSGFTSYRKFLGFGQSDWTDFYALLKTNMMNGRPAIMGINNSIECRPGHAIICDGFRTDGYYHLNYGWTDNNQGNIVDAWYNLPSGMPFYNVISECVLNLTSHKKEGIPIEISRSNLQFGGVKINQFSVTLSFTIKNNSISVITAGQTSTIEPFELSLDGVSYSPVLPNIILQTGQSQIIYARCNLSLLGGISKDLLFEVNGTKKYYCVVEMSAQGINEVGTIVSPGEISGIWKKENSPYLITGDVYVKHKDSLIIQPGVEIVFKGQYKFGIPGDAKITAKGNMRDSIVFRAEDKTTGWYGIDFIPSWDYPGGIGNMDIANKIKNTLEYCIVKDGKSFASYPQWSGGGIYIMVNENVDITISHCEISGNSSLSGGALIIGGMSNLKNKIIVNNTLISKNRANQQGIIFISGTRSTYSENHVLFTNVTITDNESSNDAAICVKSNSLAVFENCIIWGNNTPSVFKTGYDNGGITVPDDIVINYCNIDTSALGWKTYGEVKGNISWGVGNIVVNPEMETNNKYYLKTISACVDAGSPQIIHYDKENPSLPGYAAFPAKGTIRNDMGCYGGGVYNTPLTPVQLVAPPNNSNYIFSQQNNYVTFLWNSDDIYTSYDLMVSNDMSFNNIIFRDSSVTSNSAIYNNATAGKLYFWKVRGKTKINTLSDWSEIRNYNTLITNISDNKKPTSYELSQNYPNPFNPETIISYKIPLPGKVTVKIYNILGIEVAKLVDEYHDPGIYNRKMSIIDQKLASGIYFYRLEGMNYSETKKMIILK